MGIYITGVEMPGLIHGPITIRIYPTGKCINMGSLWPRDAMPGVTAIPVPEHGDLIDRDALMENAQYKGTHDIVSAWDIMSAPTIIPADKEA